MQPIFGHFKAILIYLFGHAICAMWDLSFPTRCAGSSLLHAGFSPVAASGGYSLVAVHRLLIAVASLVVEHRL